MQQLTITLSDEIVAKIEATVAAGAFPDASTLIEESVRERLVPDPAFESWLHTEVLPGIAEWEANPADGIPIDQILPRLRARQAGAARR